MVRDPRTDDPAAKLRLALDLFDSGVAMMRETLRRRFPNASDPSIAEAIAAWLRQRPGAEHGDTGGRLRDGSHL
jgi:hypothetical protein